MDDLLREYLPILIFIGILVVLGVAFIADWTNKDQKITKVLQQYQRAGVPLVLVYPSEGEAIVLPPVMSGPEKVLEALDKVGKVSP